MSLQSRLEKLEREIDCPACARRRFEIESFGGATEMCRCVLCGVIRPRLVSSPITSGAWPDDYPSLRAEVEGLCVRAKQNTLWRQYLALYTEEFRTLFYDRRGRTVPA